MKLWKKVGKVFLIALFAFMAVFMTVDKYNYQPIEIDKEVAYEVIELSQSQFNLQAPSLLESAYLRMGTVVSDITDTITTTIQNLLAGIGSAIVTYFENTFLVTDATGATDALNTVGIFVFVLLGIGAAFGLATLVFNLVRHRA